MARETDADPVDPSIERDGGLGKGINVDRTHRACACASGHDGAKAGSRRDVEHTESGHLLRMVEQVAGDSEPTGPGESPERQAGVSLFQFRGGQPRRNGDIVGEME